MPGDDHDADELMRARAAYAQGRWDEAYAAFREVGRRSSPRDHATGDHATADRVASDRPISDRAISDLAVGLATPDLAALADAAWWLGHNDESLALCEVVHERLVAAGDLTRAAEAAIETGFLWLLRGEEAVGSGWVSRATRILAETPECPAHGYLLYLEAEDAHSRGDVEQAVAAARRIHAIGVRHGDRDLQAIGLVLEGVVRVRDGEVAAGLAVVDEAMLPVRAGAVSPNWTGNLYCQLMSLFIELADYPRARAWTQATERWCDGFSHAAMFLGICRVHRAQLLHLAGEWQAAEERARQACRDLATMNVDVVAEGEYELGELRRLRGDVTAAEAAYRRAGELGRDPQPGLALLRLAAGRTEEAARLLDTSLAGRDTPLPRAPLLAARVEVAAAVRDPSAATDAADELAAIAATYASVGLTAAADQAEGVARLVAGEPERAVPVLRRSCRRWQDLGARYDVARVRRWLAEALTAVGDHDGAAREAELSDEGLTALGAPAPQAPGAAGSHAPGAGVGAAGHGGRLSAREVEVLRLVATGASNRSVAETLTLSERTVERHLSNIFVKLGVATRTEAAAVAFTHGLAPPAGR